MGMIDNLFKTAEERAKELRRRQLRAKSKTQTAILSVNTTINKLTKDKEKAWAEARKAAAAGQKTDAMLSLHQFRNYEILIYNLKKRQLYFQNCITRMETADITQTMVAALEEFNKVMEIDVNAISNVIDDLEMSNVDLDEMDSIMNTAFERETAGMEMKETENFPGVESLFDKLQGEAALEIGGGAKDIAPMSKSSINEIEAKLNSLNTSEK